MVITTSLWQCNSQDTQLIDLAFAEDLGVPYADITSAILFSDVSEVKGVSQANIISKHVEPIVMCGLPIIKTALAKLSDQCQIDAFYQEGEIISPGAILLTISGPAQILLMAERILLNFLQYLCAIATLTNKFVRKISHTDAKILDTRKTLPGFRHLAKYAVQCGGGVNHRMGLYDALMIKDTHIDLLGGMAAALDALPANTVKQFPIIVEVRTTEELEVVLEKGQQKITRVLLDNMSSLLMKECVAKCQGLLMTEASGNIHIDNVAIVAETGVDYISVGKLTHSAGNVDLSMQCEIRKC
jgi:nicotinate-nucleotide pyrophosphorylase (carboxylating)